MTKLIVASRNFVNASEKDILPSRFSTQYHISVIISFMDSVRHMRAFLKLTRGNSGKRVDSPFD
jgi:hypothetical protein